MLAVLTPASNLVPAQINQYLCWRVHDRRQKCIYAGGRLERPPAQINLIILKL
jgi:hypothetical protein